MTTHAVQRRTHDRPLTRLLLEPVKLARGRPRRAGHDRRVGRLLLPLLLVLAFTAAACGSDDDTAEPSEPAATAAPDTDAEPAAAADEESDAADPDGSGADGVDSNAADSDETDASSAAEPDEAEAASEVGGEVNLYNWTDYISEDLLTRFTSETGIAVNLANYDSNETMLATLAAGGTGYDVIVPSDYIIPQLIEQDLIQPIDAFAMENAANIDPAFLDPYFDVGRIYTAPYLYGTTGLAVDTSQVPDPPDSWAEFFAVPEGSDGSIGMMNDQVEVIHAVLRAVGATPCSTDPADYARGEELLDGFKPSVSVINSDGIIERMAAGENSIHMEWNGAAYRSWLENPDLVYVYPSDGLTLWQDNFAVPAGAPNVEQAKVFINWMMDPGNIAEATNWNGYANAIIGSDAYIEDSLASSPMVVPPPEDLAFAAPVESCSVEAIDLYDRLWTSFRS